MWRIYCIRGAIKSFFFYTRPLCNNGNIVVYQLYVIIMFMVLQQKYFDYYYDAA